MFRLTYRLLPLLLGYALLSASPKHGRAQSATLAPSRSEPSSHSNDSPPPPPPPPQGDSPPRTAPSTAPSTPPPDPYHNPPPVRDTTLQYSSSVDSSSSPQLSAQTSSAEQQGSTIPVALLTQYFFVNNKIMAGIAARVPLPYVQFDLEFNLGGPTSDNPPIEAGVSYYSFGTYASFAPFWDKDYDWRLGIGGDFYSLTQPVNYGPLSAFAIRTDFNWWVHPNIAPFIAARIYPVSDSRLNLGTKPDGSTGVPLLISIGVAFRWGNEK